MRYLNELEEATGSLLAINTHQNSLLVTMDWGQFTVHYPSTRSLQLAKRGLESYIGKKVAILLDNDSTKSLRIRLATPRSEAKMGDQEP